MKSNRISLNLFQKTLENHGFEVKLFYDRIKLYLDTTPEKSSIESIDSPLTWHEIIPRALLHYDTMALLLDAHQPDLYYLEQLDSALTGDYVVNYIEIAMDIVQSNKNRISKLRKLRLFPISWGSHYM